MKSLLTEKQTEQPNTEDNSFLLSINSGEIKCIPSFSFPCLLNQCNSNSVNLIEFTDCDLNQP